MKVKLDTKTIEVTKLPIGRYAELLDLIKTIAPDFSGLLSLNDKQIVSELPTLLTRHMPEAIKLMSIGTGLGEDEVSQFGLAECIDVITGIIEVNRYKEVYEKIKKAMSRLPKKPVTPTPVTG